MQKFIKSQIDVRIVDKKKLKLTVIYKGNAIMAFKSFWNASNYLNVTSHYSIIQRQANN